MTSDTQRMIFATGEPACAVARDGTIVAWNAAAQLAFGYSAAQAVGRKCWELLQGQDTFGNQYCGRHCPLRLMAIQGQSVNRCRMSFCTASDERLGFMVTTLVLFDTPDARLIHLCRKEPTATHGALPTEPMSGARRRPAESVLTHREREVLQYLADGQTTREIAMRLGISIRTVRTHVEHILHKLHVHSRLEAVAVSRRLGLH